MIPNSNHLANFHAISISPSSLHFLSPHFSCKFSTKDNFFCKLSYCFMVVSCFSLFYHDLPFFQSCIKSSFFFAILRITFLPNCWIVHLLEKNGIQKSYLPVPLFVWLDIYIFTGVTVVKAFRGWYTFCIFAWSIMVYFDICKYVYLWWNLSQDNVILLAYLYIR